VDLIRLNLNLNLNPLKYFKYLINTIFQFSFYLSVVPLLENNVSSIDYIPFEYSAVEL